MFGERIESGGVLRVSRVACVDQILSPFFNGAQSAELRGRLIDLRCLYRSRFPKVSIGVSASKGRAGIPDSTLTPSM